MIAHSVFFYIFSLIAIVSAVMVTVSKNTVHSVFFLILDFISISCLFIMIGAEFLGMIMLIVYVGAVAVLFLFVVMMLNVAEQKGQWFSSRWDGGTHIPVGLLVSLIIFFELIIVIGGWKYKPDLLNSLSINISSEVTNTRFIGNVLYTDYILLFQISGMILLVAMIGAIVLTFRERAGVKRQSYVRQISRERNEGVDLVDAEKNKGVKIDA
jgi:NADH-quinone oxidoreductase subunit J